MNRPATSHTTTVPTPVRRTKPTCAAPTCRSRCPKSAPCRRGVLRRLSHRFSVLGLIGLVIVVFWLVVAFIGPLVAPYKGGALTSTEIFGRTAPPIRSAPTISAATC